MNADPATALASDERPTRHGRRWHFPGLAPWVCGGIVVVALITYVTLALSERVVKVIGVNGMNALSKVMGFIILCIGIQFVVNGVIGVATDPVLIKGIRDTLAVH